MILQLERKIFWQIPMTDISLTGSHLSTIACTFCLLQVQCLKNIVTFEKPTKFHYSLLTTSKDLKYYSRVKPKSFLQVYYNTLQPLVILLDMQVFQDLLHANKR